MYEEKRKIYLSGSAYADGDGAVPFLLFQRRPQGRYGWDFSLWMDII